MYVININFHFASIVDMTMGQKCLYVDHMNATCYCLAVATKRFLPHPNSQLLLTYALFRFTRLNSLSASLLLEGNQVMDHKWNFVSCQNQVYTIWLGNVARMAGIGEGTGPLSVEVPVERVRQFVYQVG